MEVGIRLIYIYSDDWLGKQSVVKKTLSHLLGATDIKIFARKTDIRVFEKMTAPLKKFFDANHMQGSVRTASKIYTLFHDNQIVAAMTFDGIKSIRGTRSTEDARELTRFASIGNIVGGASKLFKAFLKDNPQVKSIISYSMNDLFTGEMYIKLGFVKVSDVKPDYSPIINGTRKHKSFVRLANLKRVLGDKFDPCLSEKENCHNNGIRRIYDSGKKKWLFSR